MQAMALRVLLALQALKTTTEDEHGQTLAEYGLIMAVIALAVMFAALVAFKQAFTGAFQRATDCMNGVGGCAF